MSVRDRNGTSPLRSFQAAPPSGTENRNDMPSIAPSRTASRTGWISQLSDSRARMNNPLASSRASVMTPSGICPTSGWRPCSNMSLGVRSARVRVNAPRLMTSSNSPSQSWIRAGLLNTAAYPSKVRLSPFPSARSRSNRNERVSPPRGPSWFSTAVCLLLGPGDGGDLPVAWCGCLERSDEVGAALVENLPGLLSRQDDPDPQVDLLDHLDEVPGLLRSGFPTRWAAGWLELDADQTGVDQQLHVLTL